MNNEKDVAASILLVTKLEISYNLPNSSTRHSITLKKEDTEEFRSALRKIEEELATKRAQNIVYSIVERYD